MTPSYALAAAGRMPSSWRGAGLAAARHWHGITGTILLVCPGPGRGPAGGPTCARSHTPRTRAQSAHARTPPAQAAAAPAGSLPAAAATTAVGKAGAASPGHESRGPVSPCRERKSFCSAFRHGELSSQTSNQALTTCHDHATTPLFLSTNNPGQEFTGHPGHQQIE
jgi:hypothetical protein